MIPLLRPATPEELERIQAEANLTPSSAVWVWPNEKGSPDMAVIRQCTEVDPMIFAETSGNQRRALFGWVILNSLKAMGVKEIFFEVDAEGMEDYTAILEKMGAQKTTAKPQYRYKMELQ